MQPLDRALRTPSGVLESGRFAQVAGRWYPLIAEEDDAASILVAPEWLPAIPQRLSVRGVREGEALVAVPAADVQRRVRRTIGATWQGRPVVVAKIAGPTARITCAVDETWPAQHGMKATDAGWLGFAGTDELADVHQVVEDL